MVTELVEWQADMTCFVIPKQYYQKVYIAALATKLQPNQNRGMSRMTCITQLHPEE